MLVKSLLLDIISTVALDKDDLFVASVENLADNEGGMSDAQMLLAPQCSPTSQLPPTRSSPPHSPPPQQTPQSSTTSQTESLYVQIRNERVAQIQAEFKDRFPNFEADVRDLKVVRRKGTGRKKMTWTEATRRSSRKINGGSKEDFLDSEEVSGAGEDTSNNVDAPCYPAPDNHLEDVGQACGAADDQCDGNGHQPEPWDTPGLSGVVDAAGDLAPLGKHGCIPCNLGFRDASNLQRHVKLVHEKRNILVECPRTWCNAKFDVLAKMLEHKESCVLVCPYPGCQKTFRKEKRFDSHQRYHLAMARRMSDD